MRSQRYRVRAFSYRSASRRLFHVKQFGEMCSRENRGGVCGRVRVARACVWALRVEPACSWCNACARCATIPRMENEQNTSSAASSADPVTPALDIVLASASPRRKQLLEDAGVRFVVHASEVDDLWSPTSWPIRPRRRRSWPSAKPAPWCRRCWPSLHGIAAVIGADTMVVCEGEIFRQARQPVRREAYAALPVGSHA